MAAIISMEHARPTFVSRETREDIQFYQNWIDEVLRTQFDNYLEHGYKQLERLESEAAVELGLSDHVAALKQLWRQKMNERSEEIAQDFQKNIFDAKLFRVGIVAEGEVFEINGVAVSEAGTIVPTLAGGIYTGPIEEVMFDR